VPKRYSEGKYHQIHEAIWDKEIRRLGAHGLGVYFYIRTCRHRNSEGLFYLPVSWVTADTSFDDDSIWLGLTELERYEFAFYDEENDVLLDLRALDHWEPRGRPQLKGAISRLAAVPDSPLHDKFLEIARAKAPGLADVIADPTLLDEMKKKSEGVSGDGIDTPLGERGRARARQTEEEREARGFRCRCGSDQKVQRAGDGFICDDCLRKEQKWGVEYVAGLRPLATS
jgi:hypothetical protein